MVQPWGTNGELCAQILTLNWDKKNDRMLSINTLSFKWHKILIWWNIIMNNILVYIQWKCYNLWVFFSFFPLLVFKLLQKLTKKGISLFMKLSFLAYISGILWAAKNIFTTSYISFWKTFSWNFFFSNWSTKSADFAQ